jgi:hypothetical protein
MMKMIQTFTEKDRRALEGTLLTVMGSCSEYKAMTHVEEQVSICIRQVREGIEHIAIHG